jgi:uncharacterized protein YpiB (UPF0302 family)
VESRLRETLTTEGDEPYKRWALERLVCPRYVTREEAEAAFDDCHGKIVRRSIEQRLRELKEEIDEAIQSGDTDRYNELAREQTRLNRLRVRRPAIESEVAG